MAERYYLCIDLKSFYASVECVERGLDPMTTNLAVADSERSEKTICLAITPAMKKLGIKNRCRVFEIPENVEYIMAEPRMKLYIDYAAEIYAVYLKYIAKEDIHVYSIDEVFIDVTAYLPLYNMTARELGKTLMDAVYQKTGIRANCGIGTNLYLAKVALDITAKHSDDFIGYLDESGYCEKLWDYKPITDFWRVGSGTARRLAAHGIYTMRGITKADEDMLYKVFGIDAELLIDHAWGRESTTMEDIKKYKPKTSCISSGQVLMCDYDAEDAELIVKEMMDLLCLELSDKNLAAKSVTLRVGYSNKLKVDAANGTTAFETETNLSSDMIPAVVKLYRRIINTRYKVRRINITCNNVIENYSPQISLFEEPEKAEKSREIQKTLVRLKKQFGKNAVFKAMDLDEKATTRERNRQIGGHKSGEK